MKIIFIDFAYNIHAKRFFEFFHKVSYCEMFFLKELSHSEISKIQGRIDEFDILIYADFFRLNGIGLESNVKKICISWTSDIVNAEIKDNSLPPDLFDLLIIDSDFAENLWLRAGLGKSKIYKIPYGIDINRIRPSYSDNRIEIISTRNWEKSYNQETILKAVSLIKDENFFETVNFAGDGTTLSTLRKDFHHLEVEKKIYYLGKLNNSNILDILPRYRLYISASSTDGVSVSMLEAMASGTPVLVANIESNREWINHGENGFLFETFSPDDLATKISEILENKYNLSAISRFGYRTVVQLADWDLNTQGLFVTLNSILSKD
jgi:glycosyltransferase involved in cell wall biosynthesis